MDEAILYIAIHIHLHIHIDIHIYIYTYTPYPHTCPLPLFHHNRWRHNRFDLRTFALTPHICEPEVQTIQSITIDDHRFANLRALLSLMSNSSNLGMKETYSTDSTCERLLRSCFVGINSTSWQWTCRDSVLRFQLDLRVLSTAPIWRSRRKLFKLIPPKQLRNDSTWEHLLWFPTHSNQKP